MSILIVFSICSKSISLLLKSRLNLFALKKKNEKKNETIIAIIKNKRHFYIKLHNKYVCLLF